MNSPASAGIPDLIGFAHGAAGIAWSLLELYKFTENGKLKETAEEAFRYEQSCFNSEQQNWPDYRTWTNAEQNGELNFTCAWCHGAPGIVLSRLRAYEITKENAYRTQAEASLQITLRALERDIGGNFSLCHGLAGNSEVFIYSSEVFGIPEHMSVAQRVGHYGIEKYSVPDEPWPCGIPNGAITPNLMLGTAGIGYFYLRLHDPKKTPSLLIMNPEGLLTGG
jgi:lantibiotic modifying enzyme